MGSHSALGLRACFAFPLSAARRRPSESIASGLHGPPGLPGHVVELGVLEDQVDHLALDDLVAQHVHAAGLLQPGADAPRRLAALLGHQPDLLVVVLRRLLDLLLFGDPLEDEVLLEGLGRRREAVLPQLVLVGADLVLAEPAAAAAPSRPATSPARPAA